MSASSRTVDIRRFFQNIILPTVLTIGLFVALIFAYVIPSLERNMLNAKKEAIRELVNVANGIASKYYLEASSGLRSEEEAKALAVSRIEHLRYGVDNKDYFWITDMRPVMIMHPYRTELNGTDVGEFRDPNGKALFSEMVQQVRTDRGGFVDYEWQWMDDSLTVVPKISYVRAFEPWGWIIGTGVYIEDIRYEIAAIKKRLTLVSVAISGCMAFLLLLIARHNLRAEIKRSQAEAALQVSREKYKALVEASSEGTAMFLDNECIFCNAKLQELLAIGVADHVGQDLRELLAPDRLDDIETIRRFNVGTDTFTQIETVLTSRNNEPMSVLLSLSKVTLAGRQGLIVVVKELSRDDESDEEQSERGRQLLALADALQVGIFRCTSGRGAILTDANDHLVRLLGYEAKGNLINTGLSDLAEDDHALRELLGILERQRAVSDFALQLRRKDGRHVVVAVTAIADIDPGGGPGHLYGTMVDITRSTALERQQAELCADLQGRLLFMNQPVGDWAKDIVSCEMTQPIAETARLMSSCNTEIVVIRSSGGEYVGTVTDADIRRRVITPGLPPDRPVFEIMSSPLVTIDQHETLMQAVILMQERGIEHLFVKDSSNRLRGIVRRIDLANLQQSTPDVLTAAIAGAASIEQIGTLYERLPLYVNALSESGARTQVITGAITATADAISAKLDELILRDLGVPPVPYAFVALGSEGRCEQTLLTDQDNAIIYRDADAVSHEAAREFFAQYGARMCRRLNDIGYRYCTGNIMASNPRWNQPLSVWRRYFGAWTQQPEPQNLLDSTIFFDFRSVCGDASLVTELRQHVQLLLADNPSFLVHLAREGMNYKTPLGLFGKIQTEADEEHSKGLNVKSALRVIVNLVRLYAMKQQVADTNTIRRVQRLQEANIFSSSFSRNLLQAYDYLMVLQLRTQAQAFSRGKDVTNIVDLSELSSIELGTLKNVLAQLGTFQTKCKYDFGISE